MLPQTESEYIRFLFSVSFDRKFKTTFTVLTLESRTWVFLRVSDMAVSIGHLGHDVFSMNLTTEPHLFLPCRDFPFGLSAPCPRDSWGNRQAIESFTHPFIHVSAWPESAMGGFLSPACRFHGNRRDWARGDANVQTFFWAFFPHFFPLWCSSTSTLSYYTLLYEHSWLWVMVQVY